MTKIKLLFVLSLLFFCLTLTAVANNVSNIDINVSLSENGDARITQVWQGSFYDSTENYIVIGNLNGIEIESFTVSDESTVYDELSSWNIDASRSEKKNKCGIVKRSDGGFELCWGIGDYGERTYTVSYTLTDFVASYEDLDGSNFMFVNPGMSTFPTNVTFSLSLADGTSITDDVADIWAFGFNGEIWFEKGEIRARTYSPLSDDNYFVVMFSLEKGIVTPSRSIDYKFEETKEKAFEGSDYSDGDEGMWIVYLAIGVFAIAFFAGIAYTVAIKNERKKFTASAPYFRDAPNGGKLQVSYYLAQKFGAGGSESSIIGASIMQMMRNGNITCDTEKNVGFFGKEKETHEINLNSRPEDACTGLLYDIMVSASGEDGILQEKELEKYCEKHYKALRSYIDAVKDGGETSFCVLPGFKAGISNRIKDLSDQGRSQLAEVVGLKKYLEEFSLIDERGVQEIDIWQEYLVYATLFGIADKVLEQLKKVYPDYVPQIEEYTRHVNMSGIYCASMYRSMITAEQRVRSSGSGGRASFGGGGGFSGGGYGGGSR